MVPPKARFLIGLLALLCGCSSAPQPAAWKVDAQAALEDFKSHYLAGRSAAAERAYGRAMSAISSSADLVLAQRAALVHCGLAFAAAAYSECPAPSELLGSESPADAAYRRFLLGEWLGLDADALPPAYRALVRARSAEDRRRAAALIADPVSRLVAAGVMLRTGEIGSQGVDEAIHTASAAGLRRPLLAWLRIGEQLAHSRGDGQAAAQLRARIEFALSERPAQVQSR